jgi:hypothetical protein
MKRLTILILATALAVSLAGVSGADPRPLRVDRRLVRQEMRIHRGERHGMLTRGEAWRLRRGGLRIHRVEWRARANGRFGPWERARLHRALDRRSFRIWRLEHDGRVL